MPSDKTHAAIITDMVWFDNQPEGLRRLLHEFSWDDIRQAQRMTDSPFDYEIIGRILHAGRRLTEKAKLTRKAA